jgi:hypothetical protein
MEDKMLIKSSALTVSALILSGFVSSPAQADGAFDQKLEAIKTAHDQGLYQGDVRAHNTAARLSIAMAANELSAEANETKRSNGGKCSGQVARLFESAAQLNSRL